MQEIWVWIFLHLSIGSNAGLPLSLQNTPPSSEKMMGIPWNCRPIPSSGPRHRQGCFGTVCWEAELIMQTHVSLRDAANPCWGATMLWRQMWVQKSVSCSQNPFSSLIISCSHTPGSRDMCCSKTKSWSTDPPLLTEAQDYAKENKCL